MEFIARPLRFPCGICKLSCTVDCLKCGHCNTWFHCKCENVSRGQLKAWTDSDLDYICKGGRSIAGGQFNSDKGMSRLEKIDMEHLACQDFLIGDVRVGSERHLLFSTAEQQRVLRQTKRWFMDGTFKVVNAPFRGGQLMSIHGFVLRDGVQKQIPLAFILMSRRRAEDYKAVLRKVVAVIGEVTVEGVVLDFEAGAWLTVREVFPGTQIKGCVFHWTQAVWRHVQELGLKPAYTEI